MQLKCIAIWASVVALLTSTVWAQEKPNVVYILVDNWGWGDISVQGSTTSTPLIDQLAAEGMRLTNFNIQNQCTPTRSALHTGRLPIRSGTQIVPPPGAPQGMAPWEYTIAELLSDAGYATAMYGKWHIGDTDGRLPNDQGYDEWYGIKESAMVASFTSTPQFDLELFDIPHVWMGKKGRKSKKVKEFDLEARSLIDGEIVSRTAEFVAANAIEARPFFVYAALTQIHPPFLPHPEFDGKSGAGEYADIQMQVDAYVGRILDAIDEAGVAENTVVILSGDNAAGEQSADWSGEGGSNGPWRGGLSTGYEGGIRTPSMVRWPGKIPAGRVSDEMFADLDWYPTISHLAGEADRIPKDRPIDGVNQADFLLGAQESSDRDYIVTFVGDDVFSVKWRTLKVHFFTAEGTFSPIVKWTFPRVYDIKNDPGETRELWSSEGYSHIYVMEPVIKILTELTASMQEFPNIETGQEFTGYN